MACGLGVGRGVDRLAVATGRMPPAVKLASFCRPRRVDAPRWSADPGRDFLLGAGRGRRCNHACGAGGTQPSVCAIAGQGGRCGLTVTSRATDFIGASGPGSRATGREQATSPSGRPHVTHLLERKLGVKPAVQVPPIAKVATAPVAVAPPRKAPSAAQSPEAVPFVPVAQAARASDAVESAAEFALQLLRTNPDYEMSVDDIYEEGEGAWSKPNISAGLMRLKAQAHVTQKTEPDQSVWWTFSG